MESDEKFFIFIEVYSSEFFDYVIF